LEDQKAKSGDAQNKIEASLVESKPEQRQIDPSAEKFDIMIQDK
jgi:hypothetical protein